MSTISANATRLCSSHRSHWGRRLASWTGALLLNAIAPPSHAQINVSLGGSGEANVEASGQVGTSQSDTSDSASDSGVLNLCHLPPEKVSDVGYTKQRLVLFDLDGAEVTNGPEQEINEKGQVIPGHQYYVFRDVRMHQHLRNVFFGKFPMRRHHTVAASITAPEKLWDNQVVSADDMIRAAALDPFTAYSIACAEWVVFPRVSKKEATWQRVTKQRQVGQRMVPYQAWLLGTTLTYEITTFHFENGTWVNKGKVDANNTWIDIAGAVNEGGEAVNEIGRELKGGHHKKQPKLSAIPDPNCKLPVVGEFQAIADGFGKCNDAATTVVDSARRTLQGTESKKVEGSQEEKKPEGGIDAAATNGEASSLDAATSATLSLATSGNPRATAEAMLKANAEGKLPAGAVETADAAKSMYSTCKSTADSVIQLKDRLREIATNPLATAGQAVLSFAECKGIPLSYDISGATAPGSEQSKSSFCANVNDDVSRGPQSMREVATCTGRIKGEHSTLAVRVAATNQWWHMKLPLLNCTGPVKSDTYCIAVGKSEGIRRGDQFIAENHQGERLGFGRVTAQGKGGGERAAEDLSQFRFRTGDGHVGAAMVERAKVGMLLGLRPQAALLLRHGALASDMLLGGAVEAGYNAGPYVPVGDEFWIRTHIAFMAGQEKEYFLNVEALPEAQYYLFNHVAAYVQSGIAFNFGMKSVNNGTSNENLSGFSLAAMLGGGVDAALSPDWGFRLGVTGAQAFLPMRLQNSAKTLSVDAGLLTWVQGGASVNCNF